jgi:hypothetical protein
MERQSSGNNPFGIWQSIWADLIKAFNEQMIYAISSDFPENNYNIAWTTLIALNESIPTECREDVQTTYSICEQTFYKPIKGYDLYSKHISKRNQIRREGPSALWKLDGEIITSLHKRGWINKPDFSASPKYEKKGHL